MSDTNPTPTPVASQIISDAAGVAQVAVTQGKDFYKSKTFWFNALTAGLNYAGYLPAKVAVPVAIAGNIGLRVLTTQPVSFTSILGLFR